AAYADIRGPHSFHTRRSSDLRPGIESACASSESIRLRFSWYAFVFWASSSTRIIPRQTAVASSRSAPLKAKSEVVFGAMCSWNRSEEHTSELQSRVDLVCRLL